MENKGAEPPAACPGAKAALDGEQARSCGGGAGSRTWRSPEGGRVGAAGWSARAAGRSRSRSRGWRVQGLGVVRGGANARSGVADRVRERAAGAARAGHGHADGGCSGSRRAGWTRPAAGWRRRLGKAGFDAAMLAAWQGRSLARTRPGERVDKKNVRPAAAVREDRGEGEPEEKGEDGAGSPARMMSATTDGRTDRCRPRIAAQGRRRRGDPGRVHRGGC